MPKHKLSTNDVLEALADLQIQEGRTARARSAYEQAPTPARWRAFCVAAVEAASALGRAEIATGRAMKPRNPISQSEMNGKAAASSRAGLSLTVRPSVVSGLPRSSSACGRGLHASESETTVRGVGQGPREAA